MPFVTGRFGTLDKSQSLSHKGIRASRHARNPHPIGGSGLSRSAAEAAQWRQLLSVDVGTVFVAVEHDLGRTFTEGNRRRMVRLVEKRLEVQPGRGDRRVLVREYCAQEILSDRRPLPVAYDRVLDALGLLGTPRAPGAILVAHSVAEIAPGLSGDAFIARVEDTWRAAGAAR